MIPGSVGLLDGGKQGWSEPQPPVAGKQLDDANCGRANTVIEVLKSTRQNGGEEREAALDWSNQVTIAVWRHGSSSPDALQETSPLVPL